MPGIVSSSQDFEALRLLSDPARLQQRIDQLESAQKQYQAVVDLAGPASEIIKIRQDIENDRQLARDVVEQAKFEAQTLIEKAKGEAADILIDMNAESVRRLAEVKEMETKVQWFLDEATEQRDKARASLETLENERALLTEGRQALAKDREELKSQMDELASERSRLEEARTVLKSLMGT